MRRKDCNQTASFFVCRFNGWFDKVLLWMPAAEMKRRNGRIRAGNVEREGQEGSAGRSKIES